jgi:hypothetical protein
LQHNREEELRIRRVLMEERVRLQREERIEQLNDFVTQLDDDDENNIRCKVCTQKFTSITSIAKYWGKKKGHIYQKKHTKAVQIILSREFGIEQLHRIEEQIRIQERGIRENLGIGCLADEEIDMRNYPKNIVSIDMNVEDVEWIELGCLQALGHAPETRLKPYSIKLREAMLEVIPGIIESPYNLKLWKRLFLIPIIMASEMKDKNKDREWKLKKFKEDDWSEFTLSQFKGKYKLNKTKSIHRSDKEMKENMEKEFQKQMNRGYLSKAVQVVNRSQNQTRTGEEKYNSLVSKYIVDNNRQVELIITQEMVVEAKKITFELPFIRKVIKKMRDGVSNGIDFIRTEMVKLMVEIHSEIQDMSSDAMKFSSFLVWLTNVKFQKTLPTLASIVILEWNTGSIH